MAHLLVIEDTPDNLDLMTYVLKAAGHVAVAAGDGARALELLETEHFDLIVCDVHMPGIDGFEIARRVKGDARLRCVPVIAVTALAMVGDREKVLAGGFDGYITKPINPRELGREIQAHLSAPQPLPSPPPSLSSASVQARPCGNGARLLIVDDMRANRDLMWAVFEPLGYEVTLANSAREALALLRKNRFDAVISDLNMPDEDGLWLLAEINRDPQLAAIPFVIVSSSVIADRERSRAQSLHATLFIERPVGPKGLIEVVEKTLAKGVPTNPPAAGDGRLAVDAMQNAHGRKAP